MRLRKWIIVVVIPITATVFGSTIPNFPVPAGIIVGVWLVKMYEFVHDTGN